MLLQARRLWSALTSSLWFIPMSMVGAAILLAALLTLADVHLGDDWTLHHRLLFGVGAAGARGMLAAIAGSMMTVASLTFSLTISTLAAASSQYTSRLVRNFMRDRVNQLVLGYFVGLFGYCLVVLRTIRGGDEGQFVPPIAVMGGLLLALASIPVLIYFIHHIAESIQVATILRRVTAETVRAIEALFPDGVGEEPAPGDALPAARPELAWHPVEARAFGYISSLDDQAVLRLAESHDAVVRMTAPVGAFVTPAGALCEVALPSPPDDALAAQLRAAFEIGPARTVEQDAAFGVRQIVDVALKALSPGVNDSTTAVMCVDHLAVLLESLGARAIPDELRSADGAVRVIARGRSYEALVALCLDQIRQSAAGNTAVLSALHRAVAAAGRRTRDPARRRVLARHARLVAQLGESSVTTADDRAPLYELARSVDGELAP